MSNIFSAGEIAEIAVRIEKNGKDFYSEVIKKTDDVKAKEVFRFLLDEEEEHIIAFKKILDSVNKYEPAESYPGEYFSYMNALASEHIFTQKDTGKKVGAKIKSYQEAINMGIGFEKDSIIFYEGMKKVVSQADRQAIDQVIEQEQEHFNKLTQIKIYLAKHP